MKRLCIAIVLIIISLFMQIQALAMSRPPDRNPSSPAIIPLFLSGDNVILDRLILSYSLRSDGDWLSQSLFLYNESGETQTARIAVPVYSTLLDFDKKTKITLDSETLDNTFRFANAWNEDLTNPPNYSGMITASIENDLAELSNEKEYQLVSFDDKMPLSGYTYEITCFETGTVRLTLMFNPGKTNLLIDPSDAEYGNNETGSSGSTHSRTAGNVEISIYLKKGETRNCHVLVLGSDDIKTELSHYPDYREADSESEIPGAVLNTTRIDGITPFDFYNDYIHKYDYEFDPKHIAYKRELANRYIDEELQAGSGFIDCLMLSYRPTFTGYMTAAIIEFDIAPGQSRCLTVDIKLIAGFIVSDDRKTVEKYYPVFTEPLNSFGNKADIEIIVNTPPGKDIISVMPEMIKTAEKPTSFKPDINISGNIIVLCNTKYRDPLNFEGWVLLLMIFPYNLLILLVIILIICAIVKLRKRVQLNKEFDHEDCWKSPTDRY